ncbi:MAG: 2-C-methyl-D-erythritol 2,4-cyclodiphosphate synthase [Elusimicrobiota bacterium]
MKKHIRVGIGFDVHRFAPKRKLFLGGIQIKHKYGLLGHSDADVILHAAGDAVLGALGLPDIGIHFPDTDKTLKDISSKLIIKKILHLLKSAGMRLVNLDCVIIAQSPRISPYRNKMLKSMSSIFGTKCINVKATTNEGIGFIGKNKGIACISAALLESQK